VASPESLHDLNFSTKSGTFSQFFEGANIEKKFREFLEGALEYYGGSPKVCFPSFAPLMRYLPQFLAVTIIIIINIF